MIDGESTVAIRNDEELHEAIARINTDLQLVQDYLGREPHMGGKVRFPRGFIRPAEFHRQRLPFLNNENLRHNLAYALMLSDIYYWILTRTDVKGTAREMVIKAAIFLSGAIAESLLRQSTDGQVGNRRSYKYRTNRLVEAGVIDAALKHDLDWMWDLRNNMHFFLVSDREFLHYCEEDYRRAQNAVRGLIAKLQAIYQMERPALSFKLGKEAAKSAGTSDK